MSNAAMPVHGAGAAMRAFSYDEISAATSGFSDMNLVGKGSHGSVYRAKLPSGEVVAVKVPSPAADEAKLSNEIAVLTAVGSPYIVNLVGTCAVEKMIVLEFMPHGSLDDALHSPAPPTLRRRVAAALRVANAVRSLHGGEPRVIHRDIKSANVLLDRKRRARLADFSLAVTVAPDSPAAALPAGTFGYLDPCYTDAEQLSPSSDVFSLGVLLLELVAGERAIDVDREPASIVSRAVPLIDAGRMADVVDKRLPAMDKKTADAVARMLRVAARCVSPEPELRPSAGEVAGELEKALDGVVHGRPAAIKVAVARCVSSLRRRRARARKVECDDGEQSDSTKS